MTKKQQTFQLPCEMIAWIKTEERRTGATLSRIAHAAFLAYASHEPPDQRDVFMGLAIDIERGMASLSNLAEELNQT